MQTRSGKIYEYPSKKELIKELRELREKVYTKMRDNIKRGILGQKYYIKDFAEIHALEDKISSVTV